MPGPMLSTENAKVNKTPTMTAFKELYPNWLEGPKFNQYKNLTNINQNLQLPFEKPIAIIHKVLWELRGRRNCQESRGNLPEQGIDEKTKNFSGIRKSIHLVLYSITFNCVWTPCQVLGIQW